MMNRSKGMLEFLQKKPVVMNFIQTLEEFFNSGDPEVRTFFLVRQTYLPFLLCSLYALFSWKLGPALMRNRKPFSLQKIMVVFNFATVFAYLTAIVMCIIHLPTITWHEFCIEGKVIKGKPTYMLARTAHLIYLLKYIQFLDTIFFILRKKEQQITFLHIIHHTSVPIIGWILMRTEKSGMQSFPVILNGIVHIVMYTYYGLSAMGPQVRKHLWWKKHLTQMQMVQFILIIIFVSVIAPFSGCTMVCTGYVMNTVFPLLFLYLFYLYYKMNFQTKMVKSE